MNNYQTIYNQIKEYCFKHLKNNTGPLESLQKLRQENPDMIDRTKNLELLSSAIIYSYLRAKNLNGKGGITTKDLANYFNLKSGAITSKVFDVDCIINREKIFPNEPYEFIDIDRFEIMDQYYDFLEYEHTFKESQKILKSFIKKDPNFFDPYTILYEEYLAHGQKEKAIEILTTGYNIAIKYIQKSGKFPDILAWGWHENRHIIRILFNFATVLWASDYKGDALKLFQNLLLSNPNDNIGARYSILAILEGFGSQYELEEKFASNDGYLDWKKQEKWFNKNIVKYPKELGWWLELDDEF